jgi:hypothetical protein
VARGHAVRRAWRLRGPALTWRRRMNCLIRHSLNPYLSWPCLPCVCDAEPRRRLARLIRATVKTVRGRG